MAALTVLKVGGDLATRADWRARVAGLVDSYRSAGTAVVLVHGGGPQLDAALEEAGLQVERVAGRRITSPQVLELAIRIWRGTLSLQWVETLRAAGLDAVGLSGLDGGLVLADRRPPTVIDGHSVDFGCVGDIVQVRPSVVDCLLGAGIVPVISPLAACRSGGALNVNADTVAAHLAVALKAEQLVLLTRSPGVLADPDDPATTLATATLDQLDAMERTGTLHSGMRPKLAAIRHALRHGVPRAQVRDGRSSTRTTVSATA